MIRIKFYTDDDVLLASCEASQVPPNDSSISISDIKYRVEWTEWKVQAGLCADVFLVKT